MRVRHLLITAALIAAGSAHAEKIVLGKLGQAIERTPIYSRPSTRSHVYYRTGKYQYLVINTASNAAYTKVLMNNGATGYVATDAIAKLPYSVTADTAPARSYNSKSSRAGSLRWTLTSMGSPTTRAEIAQDATMFAGAPYKFGGNNPLTGIDCSAFVKMLYGKIGVDLPRTAAQQVNVGTPVLRLEDLQSGDRLYFWSSKRGMIGHTGIYLGNGYFVHSSSNNHGVATDYLSEKWRRILIAARR